MDCGATYGCVIIRGAKLASEALTHEIQNEITAVKIIMGLMSRVGTSLNRQVQPIVVGPARPHRRPGIGGVAKVVVQRKAIPPATTDGWVIPEEPSGLRRVNTIPLEQRVHRIVENGAVKHHAVSGGAELIRPVVPIVEQRRHASDIYVVETGGVELAGHHAVEGTSGRQQ